MPGWRWVRVSPDSFHSDSIGSDSTDSDSTGANSESTEMQIRELQERVQLLEQENARLTDQAEDMLLLGVILEAISPLNDCPQILNEGLERIALLKNIPLCCCGTVEHGVLRVLNSSLSFSSASLNGCTIALNGIINDQDQPRYLSGAACAQCDLPALDDFCATEILLLPCHCRFLSDGVFLFACNLPAGTQLDAATALLGRIVDAVMLKMDNVMVVDVLRDINSKLDQRVEEHSEALYESESQYRSLIDQAMDNIFVFDADSGQFLDVNAAACSCLGYSREDMLGLTITDVVVSQSVEFLPAVIDRLEAEGTIVLEGLHRRQDGDTFPVETHLGLILIKDGIRVLAISHDITERKEAENRLSRAHALLQSLLNGIPDLISFKNTQGIYLGCNQAFCEFVGKRNQDQVVGITDYDMFDADLADSFRRNDQAMLVQEKPQRNEEWVNYPDGRKVLLDTLKTPYYGPNSEQLGVIGISRDITEQRQTEEQLLQAQKMEGIGTLVGGIAHDFNNMLAGMMGNLYLISHDVSLSSDGLVKIERINELCERATNMIAQLLTFARKGMIRMQPVAFRPFLQEALELAELAIPENIQLIHAFDADESITVMGDEVQLQQMVLNLLVNARDAVNAVSRPRIHVGLKRIGTEARLHENHQGLGDGPWLELSVTDNGCGIPESIRDQLFEPFFTTKDVGEGTGLGLSTVYGVVQSHQGAIQIDSKQHEGATFRIYLPSHGEQVMKADNSSGQLPRGHGETILLVDDEQIVLTTTSALLTHLGYRVITAHHGLDALEKEGLDSVKLALLDVVMPEMGGVETAGRLRAINPNMPIIFATAYDRKKVLEKQDQLSNSWILNKPFRLQLLATALQDALQKS